MKRENFFSVVFVVVFILKISYYTLLSLAVFVAAKRKPSAHG